MHADSRIHLAEYTSAYFLTLCTERASKQRRPGAESRPSARTWFPNVISNRRSQGSLEKTDSGAEAGQIQGGLEHLLVPENKDMKTNGGLVRRTQSQPGGVPNDQTQNNSSRNLKKYWVITQIRK